MLLLDGGFCLSMCGCNGLSMCEPVPPQVTFVFGEQLTLHRVIWPWHIRSCKSLHRWRGLLLLDASEWFSPVSRVISFQQTTAASERHHLLVSNCLDARQFNNHWRAICICIVKDFCWKVCDFLREGSDMLEREFLPLTCRASVVLYNGL